MKGLLRSAAVDCVVFATFDRDFVKRAKQAGIDKVSLSQAVSEPASSIIVVGAGGHHDHCSQETLVAGCDREE
jgi:hypothetical protein